MLTASLTCLFIGAVFVGGGFTLGRFYERQQPQAPVFVLRHPLHHHRARHVRVVHDPERVVVPLFDFDAQENA